MHRRLTPILALALTLAACGSGVDSDEAAEAAYLGLDGMVGKSLSLGFDGFNAATSANIPEQMTTGDVTGTLSVSGQVDMGASANKEMRLFLALVEYRDEVPDSDLVTTYDTAEAAPAALTLSLRGIPDATMTGTLVGRFIMVGDDVNGPVDLDLTITGMTEADPDAVGNIRRVTGSTTVVGTATSDFGVFNVNVTL
jgi:hypothetical protein